MRRSSEDLQDRRSDFPRVSIGGRRVFCGALLGALACGGDDAVRQHIADSDDGTRGNLDESTTGDQPPYDPAPIQALLSQYRTWLPRTDAPTNVSNEIFVLCRSPTRSENAFVGSEHGEGRMLMDWLNPEAQAGFESLGAQEFAPGAAIVKEKLNYLEGAAAPQLVAIGIMLEREPGFDSNTGDWEFAYWEEAPGLIVGPDQSAYCGACHASSPTDFVFLDDSWRDSSQTE